MFDKYNLQLDNLSYNFKFLQNKSAPRDTQPPSTQVVLTNSSWKLTLTLVLSWRKPFVVAGRSFVGFTSATKVCDLPKLGHASIPPLHLAPRFGQIIPLSWQSEKKKSVLSTKHIFNISGIYRKKMTNFESHALKKTL